MLTQKRRDRRWEKVEGWYSKVLGRSPKLSPCGGELIIMWGSWVAGATR